MSFRQVMAREGYVALHAQTWKFRVVKYIVIVAIGWGVHAWGGWPAVGRTFAVLLVVALFLHFIFRWKTKAWTQAWGGFKPLKGMK